MLPPKEQAWSGRFKREVRYERPQLERSGHLSTGERGAMLKRKSRSMQEHSIVLYGLSLVDTFYEPQIKKITNTIASHRYRRGPISRSSWLFCTEHLDRTKVFLWLSLLSFWLVRRVCWGQSWGLTHARQTFCCRITPTAYDLSPQEWSLSP